MRMKPFRAVAFALAALVAASVAMPAHADCFDEAALYQKVNPLILRAIANHDMSLSFAALFVAALIGLVLSAAIGLIERLTLPS